MFDLALLSWCAGVLGVALVVLWLISLAIKNSSIIDIFWGSGFAIIAWLGWWRGGGLVERKLLVAVLVTLWGGRLSLYLALRNLGHGEDKRYTMLRAKHQPWWLISLFMVFGLQGALMLIVSLPVHVMQTTAAPLGVFEVVGALLVLGGVAFEGTADWQLAQFKKGHVGQVMRTGLWRYTRHPNYFGDFVVWWGVWTMSLGVGGAWTIVGPLMMSFLLMRVSGVPMLEKTMRARPGYDEYVATTNSFFPGPVKKRA